MDKALIPLRKRRTFSLHRFVLLLLVLVALTTITVAVLWNRHQAAQLALPAGGIPGHPEIEERFGVRVTGIHLLARHGLVDLRYRVVDAGKAKNFGHYTETSPLLIAEDSGRKVEVTIMGLHNHRVETGRVYYILYRNTADALDPGSRVTVKIGDLSLRHVPVQ